MIRTNASLLALAFTLAACASLSPVAGTPLSTDSGLRQIRIEALGLE